MNVVKFVVYVLGAVIFLSNAQARANPNRGPETRSRAEEILKRGTTRPHTLVAPGTQPTFKFTPPPKFDFGVEPRHTPLFPLMKKEENKWTTPAMVRWYVLCAVILIGLLGRK